MGILNTAVDQMNVRADLLQQSQDNLYNSTKDIYDTLAAIKMNATDPDFVVRTCEEAMSHHMETLVILRDGPEKEQVRNDFLIMNECMSL